MRPSPSATHFLLTHGRWLWDFVNATFIREMLMRLVLTGGWGTGPPLIWRSNQCCQLLKFLASDKGDGWGDSVMPDETSPSQEKAGEGMSLGEGNFLSPSFLPSAVRSNLIPSPPTYDSAHDYLNWESFSNMSYYTRILPSVPQDCPTPMGTKGNGGGRGRLGLLSCPLWEKAGRRAILDPFCGRVD